MTTTTRYNFHTTEILQSIKKTLHDTTGVEVFCGDRPTNNAKQRDEMLTINLPYSIRQKGVVQSTYLRIEIIVKDKKEGRSNLARLEELSNKIIELFPLGSANGRFYTTDMPNLVLRGKDAIGFTIWNLQCGLNINKTDTYNI